MADQPIRLRGNKLEVVKQLADAALAERGWKYREVRGWMFSDEFDTVEVMLAHGTRVHLVRDQMIVREGVHDPGRRAPMYLYRVTQCGVEVLIGMGALPQGVAVKQPAEKTERDKETIFMTMDAWRALEFLAAQQGHAWVEAAAIRTNSARSILPEDLDFLLKSGLMERDIQKGVRRYRATALGRRSQALDVMTIRTRAQVLVPGMRENVQPPPGSTAAPGHTFGRLADGERTTRSA